MLFPKQLSPARIAACLALSNICAAEITSLITVVNLSEAEVTVEFTNQESECISRDFDSSKINAYLDAYIATTDGAFGDYKLATGIVDLRSNLWGFADSHTLPPGQIGAGNFQTYWAAMDNAPGCLTAQSNQWFVVTTPNDTYAFNFVDPTSHNWYIEMVKNGDTANTATVILGRANQYGVGDDGAILANKIVSTNKDLPLDYYYVYAESNPDQRTVCLAGRYPLDSEYDCVVTGVSLIILPGADGQTPVVVLEPLPDAGINWSGGGDPPSRGPTPNCELCYLPF